MKKETELTFTCTGEKWQRAGSEGTTYFYLHGGEVAAGWQRRHTVAGRQQRQAGSGGNRGQQAVSESTRVGSSLGTTAKEGWEGGK